MEKKSSDPVAYIILAVTVAIIGGLALHIDWSRFGDFGKTSTPTPTRRAEPVKRLQGFGLQCELDDEITPCMYRTVNRKEFQPTKTK